MLKPCDRASVKGLLDGNMRHRAVGARAVPVPLIWLKDDDIPGFNWFNRTAIALNPAKASGNNQRLPQWMRMPGGPRAGRKRDICTPDAGWLPRLRVALYSDTAGEPLRRTNANCAITRLDNFHSTATVWQFYDPMYPWLMLRAPTRRPSVDQAV